MTELRRYRRLTDGAEVVYEEGDHREWIVGVNHGSGWQEWHPNGPGKGVKGEWKRTQRDFGSVPLVGERTS